MKLTIRQIAKAVNKPESTVYRWRNENHDLFLAAKQYAERKHQHKVDKPDTID